MTQFVCTSEDISLYDRKRGQLQKKNTKTLNYKATSWYKRATLTLRETKLIVKYIFIRLFMVSMFLNTKKYSYRTMKPNYHLIIQQNNNQILQLDQIQTAQAK